MRYVTKTVAAYGPANLFNLSSYAEESVSDSQLTEGFVFLFSTGSTGALVNLTKSDEEAFLDFAMKLINYHPLHRHPGNAFAHIRSSFWGTEIVLPVASSQIVSKYKPYLLENTAGRKSRRIIFVLQGQFLPGGLTNMNVSTAKLPLKANGWIDLVDLTGFLNDYVKQFGVNEGMLNVFCLDKQSSIITTEYETNLLMDTADFLSNLTKDVPKQNRPTVAANIIGQSKSLPIKDGMLDLGTWQQVVFVDFGKAGEKEVFVQAVGF